MRLMLRVADVDSKIADGFVMILNIPLRHPAGEFLYLFVAKPTGLKRQLVSGSAKYTTCKSHFSKFEIPCWPLGSGSTRKA
jgi:hypothetical protein